MNFAAATLAAFCVVSPVVTSWDGLCALRSSLGAQPNEGSGASRAACEATFDAPLAPLTCSADDAHVARGSIVFPFDFTGLAEQYRLGGKARRFMVEIITSSPD